MSMIVQFDPTDRSLWLMSDKLGPFVFKRTVHLDPFDSVLDRSDSPTCIRSPDQDPLNYKRFMMT